MLAGEPGADEELARALDLYRAKGASACADLAMRRLEGRLELLEECVLTSQRERLGESQCLIDGGRSIGSLLRRLVRPALTFD